MAGNRSDMTRKVERRIGVIGPRGAGKTAMLYACQFALDNTPGLKGTITRPHAGGGDEDLFKSVKESVEKGYWPRPTPVSGSEEFELYIKQEGDPTQYHVRFQDPAGELFEDLDGSGGSVSAADLAAGADEAMTRAELRARREKLVSYLLECDGLLIVLDCRMLSREAAVSVRDVLTVLLNRARQHAGGGSRFLRNDMIAVPVAVVFAKADALRWQATYRQRDARSWMEGDPAYAGLLRHTEEHCERVRFCFASSVGWRRGAPDCRSLVLPGTAIQIYDRRETSGKDLLPSPAVIPEERPRGVPFLKSLPHFQDPTRIVHEDQDSDHLPRALYGIYDAPSRIKPEKDQQRGGLVPWNLLDGLFFAAGLTPRGRRVPGWARQYLS